MQIRSALRAAIAVVAVALPVGAGPALGGNPTACSPWEQFDDNWPHVANNAAAAFDAAREVVVVVLPDRDSVWEWDGLQWRRIEPAHPPAISYQDMVIAYDNQRGKVVLHGGDLNFPDSFVTLAWDGADWEELPGACPVLIDHAAAFDSYRNQLVVFGGRGPGFSDDTWEYDGSEWTLAAASGPDQRYGHALAFDPVRNVTVLFGGFRSTFLGDTWEWDGVAWTQRAATGPSPRFRHAMTYSPTYGGVVLYGGDGLQGSAGHLDDLWLWDGQTWTQLQQSTPPARFGHALANDPIRNKLVVYGGQTPSLVTKELWEITPSGSDFGGIGGPGDQADRAAAFDSGRGVVVLHGEEVVGAFGGTAATWEWNGTTWTRVVGGGPAPRIGAQMAFDSNRGVTVLFGGYVNNASLYDNATWEWDGILWRRISAHGPNPGYFNRMTYDAARKQIILYGAGEQGVDNPAFNYSNTWAWNGLTWSLLATDGPFTQEMAITYDPLRERVVQIYNAGNGSTVTSEWNGNEWSLRSSSGPPARRRPILAYDSVRERVILYGGHEGFNEPLGDLWEWDGVKWTQRAAPNGPVPRVRPVGAFDSVRGEFVLHSGQAQNGSGLYDTWTLTSLPLPPGDVNGDAAVTMADLMLVVDRFNTQTNHPADLNRDGAVDFTDLNLVLANFNQSCR